MLLNLSCFVYKLIVHINEFSLVFICQPVIGLTFHFLSICRECCSHLILLSVRLALKWWIADVKILGYLISSICRINNGLACCRNRVLFSYTRQPIWIYFSHLELFLYRYRKWGGLAPMAMIATRNCLKFVIVYGETLQLDLLHWVWASIISQFLLIWELSCELLF